MNLKIIHEPSDDTDQSVKIEFTADEDHECGFCHTVSPAKRFGVHWICLDCLSNADDMISDMLHKTDFLKRERQDLYCRVVELESRNRNLTIGMYAANDTLQKAMKDAGLEVA